MEYIQPVLAQVVHTGSISSPHAIVGNGQHLPVSALVLAAALFSVQLDEEECGVSAFFVVS